MLCLFMLSISAVFQVSQNQSFLLKTARIVTSFLRGIDNLKFYQQLIGNWTITNLSYEEMLNGDPETFIYLDPPYDIKDNLYGKKGAMHKKFDHDLFAKRMDFCDSKCMVSYNSSQLIRDRFKQWKTYEFDLTYTMRSVGQYMKEQQDRKEILLLNYEV